MPHDTNNWASICNLIFYLISFLAHLCNLSTVSVFNFGLRFILNLDKNLSRTHFKSQKCQSNIFKKIYNSVAPIRLPTLSFSPRSFFLPPRNIFSSLTFLLKSSFKR